jgi:C-terminal processing protease CtpA/Prc
MKKIPVIFLLIITILISCNKMDVEPDIIVIPDEPTTEELARDYLYTAMKQYYLWYKQMPVVVKEDYENPADLLEAMRYRELDRWSFTQTYQEYEDMSQGSFVGHGISLALDPSNNVRIAQIYKNSPLYIKGVRRGWIVKKLNNTDLAPIFIANDGAAYNALIGPSTANVTNNFVFVTPQAKDSTISSQKAAFTLNTVLLADTLHLKSGIAGHLVFDQFIPPSNAELATAFAFFSTNNITDLIVDLRYNGGGDLSVLTNLASYVAGSAKFNTPFLTLTFNDKNTSHNVTYKFNTIANPVTIRKLVVITTRGTASASEDFINGLKPIVDVKTLGDTTNGKPVGMIGIPYRTDYMFWPISFTLVNSLSQGEFYDGIIPEKIVADDITRDWNDRNELCFKEAIYYLENGNVSSKGLYVGKISTTKFDEKSEKSKDAYIISK